MKNDFVFVFSKHKASAMRACLFIFAVAFVVITQGAEPIAKCNLQTISIPKTDPLMMNAASIINATSAENTPIYRRGPTGDWFVPEKVDLDDASVRALLATPDGPVLIELQIKVDGKPFRELSERWIKTALEARDNESVKPNGTKEKSLPETAPAEAKKTVPSEPSNNDLSEDKKKTDKSEVPNQNSVEKENSSKEKEIDSSKKPEKTPAEKPSESGEDSDEEEKGKTPAVKLDRSKLLPAAPNYQAATPQEWLTNYVRDAKKSDTVVTPYELRYMLAQRAGGPTLIELERFSTKRSTSAPLVHFLDWDGDGILSADEVKMAPVRLEDADFNQDDIVDLKELDQSRAAKKMSTYRVWHPEPIITAINDKTDWSAIARKMKNQYTKLPEIAKTIRAESLQKLSLGKPWFMAVVNFGNQQSSLGVQLVNFSLAKSDKETQEKVRSGPEAIAISFPHCDVEIAANQPEKISEFIIVSIGAVVEGSPLWNLVDEDHNNRLTHRERNQLPAILKNLDQDGDGALSYDEIPTRIRVGVTLGPKVHDQLARAVPAIPRTPVKVAGNAPDWFTGMDKNNDHELSRVEFLGEQKLFDEFDKNHDGFISVSEANEVQLK